MKRFHERHPLWIFIGGWVRLAEGLACILSLGFYYPEWTIHYMLWKLNFLYPLVEDDDV
jgi:hypothetical protein